MKELRHITHKPIERIITNDGFSWSGLHNFLLLLLFYQVYNTNLIK